MSLENLLPIAVIGLTILLLVLVWISYNIWRKIETYLQSEKVYQLNDLSLGELASVLEIPKHHLSQVINEKMGCGYIELINRYRVQDAIQLLKSEDKQELSLMEIARNVGFNSKSTFYAAFKKETNKSPGQYRRSVLRNTKMKLI